MIFVCPSTKGCEYLWKAAKDRTITIEQACGSMDRASLIERITDNICGCLWAEADHPSNITLLLTSATIIAGPCLP